MEHISREMLEFIRQQNPKGTRIRLYSMPDDPHPIEEGSLGTLQFIDDMGTFHVKWDNVLNVHLWSGGDWTIMTEEERFGDHQQALPEVCWSTLPSDGSLILITRGEAGFTPCPNSSRNPKMNRYTADFHNRQRGITPAQEWKKSLKSLKHYPYIQ